MKPPLVAALTGGRIVVAAEKPAKLAIGLCGRVLVVKMQEPLAQGGFPPRRAPSGQERETERGLEVSWARFRQQRTLSCCLGVRSVVFIKNAAAGDPSPLSVGQLASKPAVLWDLA